MRKKLPPLNWLRAFETAARHLSFTNAAEELHITQSAVSKQVKLLEHYLEQPLFLRGRRGLTLTEAGRNYLPTVIHAFQFLEQGTHNFLGYSRGEPLRVKANFGFAIFWLCHHLDDFLDRHPDVVVSVSTALWDQDFASAQADVEIRYGRGEWEGEKGHRLTDEVLVPVCAPAVAKRLRKPADLAGERILHLTGFDDGWNYWAEQAGLTSLVGIESHSFSTFVLTLNLLRNGTGVSVAHETLITDLLARGELVVPFDIPVPARDTYYLLMPHRDYANAAAKLFAAWLQETLAADKVENRRIGTAAQKRKRSR